MVLAEYMMGSVYIRGGRPDLVQFRLIVGNVVLRVVLGQLPNRHNTGLTCDAKRGAQHRSTGQSVCYTLG